MLSTWTGRTLERWTPVREWKGINNNAFKDQQRVAVEDISRHLTELTAAIKRISENKMPSINDDSNIAKPKDQ